MKHSPVRSRSLCALAGALCLVLLWPRPATVHGISYEKGEVFVDLTGFLEANFTVPLHQGVPPEDPSAQLRVEGVLDIGDSLRFKVTPKFTYDGMVRDPRDWDPLESFCLVYPGKPFTIELDEAYVRYSRRHWDLKAGIQKVIWGNLDEFNPVDNLNPQDFSRFVTYKKIDRKIGIPMVKLDVFPPFWDLTVEGVWVPFFVPYRMPRPGEKWFPPIFYIPEVVDVGIPGIPPVHLEEVVPETNLPPRTFENSEAAVRISRTFRSVDAAISYFHGYDTATPVFRGVGVLDVSLGGFPPELDPKYTVALLPQFNKINVFGLELTAAIQSVTLRTQWAYIQGAYHTVNVNLDDVLATVEIPSVDEIARKILENLITTGEARAVFRVDPELSLKRDAVAGGVGFDYLWGNHMITGQINVNYISRYDPRLLMDEFDVSAVLNLRFSWLDDSLNADLAGMYNFSETCVVLTPEVAYRITPNLRASLRLVYIEGPRDTFIGQYKDNDQIMLRARYSF